VGHLNLDAQKLCTLHCLHYSDVVESSSIAKMRARS
jgi:hypothetical protein